jgi:RNA polymerase sigma-70 factor (ECF subfamily)
VIEPTGEVAWGDHYARILRYVHSVVRNPDEAADLTQATFLRAYRARDSLRDPDAVLPWLYSVATHVCLDRLRQRTRQERARSDVDPEAVSPPDPEPSAGLLAEQADMSNCVEAYVSELSDSYRAVLLMHDVKGLTAREIGELLGDSTGGVKIRLHRARKQLRAALEAGCEFTQDERGTLVCDPKADVYPAAPLDRHIGEIERRQR